MSTAASGGYTITLPTEVEDDGTQGDDYGEPVSTGNRPPRDLCLVEIVTAGEEPELHLYDAQRAEWVRLDGLVVNSVAARLSDEAPLSGRSADGLASMVAKKIAEDYGQTVSPETQATAIRFLSNLASVNAGLSFNPSYL